MTDTTTAARDADTAARDADTALYALTLALDATPGRENAAELINILRSAVEHVAANDRTAFRNLRAEALKAFVRF